MKQKTVQIELDDGCGGISVLADGSRAYWAEGRSSEIVVQEPDGSTGVFIFDARNPGTIFQELDTLAEEGFDEYRPATKEEEDEWTGLML